MADEETASVAEGAEENTEESLLMYREYYKSEELHSKPFVTPESDIPENLLHLSHSFGYDSGRRSNLQLLDNSTLLFIAGNLLVLMDVATKEQRFLRSCSGGGIGAITVHPNKEFFVVAEKGIKPDIILYDYPTLRPYRILRGGTKRAYCFVEFNPDGSLLASLGAAPDYMLTLWDWTQETVMLSCKALSQEVYRVSFSPHNPGLLTSSGSGHIKFWKMTNTFTGLKLQGLVGHFGKTPATDIDGYVELPDGKVVSGTDWGNLLLWDGTDIKVEICRKKGRSCHAGKVQPFALEEGQLMTIGSDGAVRGWDFEGIDAADCEGDSGRFEMEPINELLVGHGHNICLSSVVRSPVPDSFVWFAQDSGGAIWKLDLSFTNMTPDPECLFTFHAGAIQGLGVSPDSHLMATTSPDHSVRVFDFLAKRELTTTSFNQGGTALTWAPPARGGFLATGFEDGVVRLLELYDPRKLNVVTGPRPKGDARLRLKQAFKPHVGPITAVAYDRDADMLATGGSDCTVFFFAAGENYSPIGFVRVPGPVQALEWSPHTHSENRLLVLCERGHVVEVHRPDPEAERSTETFELLDLPRRSFRFRSIKSRIKREEEIARRQEEKEKKKKEQQEAEHQHEEEEEEEEEAELPPIRMPDHPSPLYCGFYSQPGQFWLSMGGFDSGFLYHCTFSARQDEDPDQRTDEPFDFRPVHNADEDPIRSITFSSNRQLLLCGMHSGSVRVYMLHPGDHRLASMKAYWALAVHDNQYGQLRHICCSYDDLFVLTAADDGNIFSFSLLPPEELQEGQEAARVPSPRVGLENEALAQDIEDPSAESIVTAKQKLEKDRLQREAEQKIAEKRKTLAELQKKFKLVLEENQRLPEQVRLKPEELELDPCFREDAERMKSQRMMEVRRELGWEEERCQVALCKLQDGFRDSLESSVVTVVAVRSDHRVSTYHLPPITEPSAQLPHQSRRAQLDEHKDAAPGRRKARAEPAMDSEREFGEEEEVLCPQAARPAGIKLGDRQIERLQKAGEKAEQARAKIVQRKQEWAELYAEKPDEHFEDPQDLQEIQEARENVGDLKLKTDKEFRVPKHLRTNSERKTAELTGLEENIRVKQTEINRQVVALRDSKVRLVSELRAQARQLREVQRRLAAHLRRPPPVPPPVLPEEAPGQRLQCDRATLERYRALREQRSKSLQQQQQQQGEEEDEEGTSDLLEQLEKEMEENTEDDWQTAGEEASSPSPSSAAAGEEDGEETELDEELRREEEIRLLYERDSLLEQMETSVSEFDGEHLRLRRQKLHLDWRLALGDLRLLTLYQELLLLKDLERREESVQAKLDDCMREENEITSKREECNEQLELKQRDIVRLREREKALVAAFQATLGENNKFEDFLTKVFKKKMKRVKKKELTRPDEEDVHSDEDSDEDDDSDDSDDDDNSDSDEGGPALDDSVCPPGCELQLFENALQLRERRLDLEELLMEEKKSAEALKDECDALVKKEKVVRSSRMALEDDMELANKEKQQKMNELDVVVSLPLHQIEFVVNNSVPSDLGAALVVDRAELNRLKGRIEELQGEKSAQRDLTVHARQHHTRLIHDCKDMKTEIQELEEECNKLMLMKFGRVVDLKALLTLSGNRVLEELKQEKLLREAAYDKETKEWHVKVDEAHQALMEVTKRNTEILRKKKNLLDETMELERKLNGRQNKIGFRQFQDHTREVDHDEIRRLQMKVKKQTHQADALRREIELLNRKGAHVPPPSQALLPPLARTGHAHRHGPAARAPKLLKAKKK
ncbi:putative cilia- and flagella-associated protein 44 [Scophthalmus maximus]|uniref:Cilia- and flagella-associated protein 44 n=1 Tax=Scophthalmus maximus TaxID=52904 RepID=A0A2U9CEH9_SCOMX|nr:putative cilia- and flagella-associated protein 44 [Scophthalmus maximus]